jgi:DMSO/TMAO reductase YedYZ molybdopterin-dependent catalytic subunit
VSAPAEDPGPGRVQRLVPGLHPVHLEAEAPAHHPWEVAVDGLVERPLRLALADLAALSPAEQTIDFHCVWGWSRPGCRWLGVAGSDLLAHCRPLARATCAVFAAAQGPYASCVRLDDVADGIVAWQLDGEQLEPIHGGPLRFVPPARLWGYKGVKWLGRIAFVERFEPGFWEQKVGDVEGRVPAPLLALFAAPPGGRA